MANSYAGDCNILTSTEIRGSFFFLNSTLPRLTTGIGCTPTVLETHLSADEAMHACRSVEFTRSRFYSGPRCIARHPRVRGRFAIIIIRSMFNKPHVDDRHRINITRGRVRITTLFAPSNRNARYVVAKRARPYCVRSVVSCDRIIYNIIIVVIIIIIIICST